MCNAWNHPSNCICGWGGFGHLGRREAEAHVYRDYGSIYSWVPPIKNTYESYVNPNAWCPVCGAPVFFYQSSDGGRVFFDELGPPWPKHPCTDNGREPKNINLSLSYGTQLSNVASYSWQKNGWEPFFINDVSKIDNFVIKISGVSKDTKLNLYFRKMSFQLINHYFISDTTIAYLKAVTKEKYNISIITPYGKSITFYVYRFASDARILPIRDNRDLSIRKNTNTERTKTYLIKRNQKPPKEKKADSVENNKKMTAIALAFAKAEEQKKQNKK